MAVGAADEMSRDRQLVANAGICHVARELSRHGWLVTLTVTHARLADFSASSRSDGITHLIKVRAHSEKPNDTRLGLIPETLDTPWWVFVAHAMSAAPTCYVLPIREVRERMVRDPGTRSGKPLEERLWWLDRRFFTPGSDRELCDAREAWHRLGNAGV